MGPAEIDSMPKPPYEGQGAAVPTELNLDGYWIIEERLLLARLPPAKRCGLVFSVFLGEGKYCQGIDADLLANEMDAIPDGNTLVEMNRDQCLAVSMETVAPAPGALYGTFFTVVTPWGGCYFGRTRRK